jgi:REP element-mobilizing transposase RayT
VLARERKRSGKPDSKPVIEKMKLFKSKEPNTFHYITAVTFNRVPVFARSKPCEIFVENLRELRTKHPFKLVGYVIMPDHVHMILNPLECDISVILRKLKGKSAKQILDWLKENDYQSSLKKLELNVKDREYAVWQRDSSAIDLFSDKFLRQKLDYIHLNPVRAELCDHPAKWKWSSFQAYLPHKDREVPIEMDWQPFWREEEFRAANIAANLQI